MAERPLGVTILGILWIIAGLAALIGGLGAAVFVGIFAGALGAAIGVLAIIIGLIELALGVGCFMAWPWVWPVGVIVTIIGLIIGIVNLFSVGAGALIGIVISAIILWYLFQPQVKKYFGAA
jgi:hypothetical protein